MLCKSIGKSKEYALSIVSWYCSTDKEDKEVADLIEKIWATTTHQQQYKNLKV